jgi:hypothetical protein
MCTAMCTLQRESLILSNKISDLGDGGPGGRGRKINQAQ